MDPPSVYGDTARGTLFKAFLEGLLDENSHSLIYITIIIITIIIIIRGHSLSSEPFMRLGAIH